MTKAIFIYIISALLIFIILGLQYYDSYVEYLDVHIINITYLLAFAVVIFIFLKYKNARVSQLLVVCLLFNLAFGFAYVVSINKHTDLLFQYVPSDAPFYDAAGRQVSQGDLIESIQAVMTRTNYGIDDMGMVIYVGLVYKITDSPLLVKLINLFINLLSTYLIFKIGRHFMSKKFALLGALCFSISSFNIWFLIVGLKEPIVILIILSYFYSLLKFMNNRKPGYLLLMLFAAVSLLFFRTALMLFVLISTIAGVVFRKGIGFKKAIAILFLIVFTGGGIYINKETIQIYLKRENVSVYAGDTETSSNINFAVVFAAGLFGPFPTIIPKTEKRFADISVYAPSLIFKVFISLFFLFGIYFILKEKHYHLIPIIAFCCVEIMALTLIDNTFKLRYAFPHYPFFYIISFYGLYYIYEKKVKETRLLREVATGFQLASLAIILLWNVLRL